MSFFIEMIDNANNGKFVTDRKLQCYYKCMLLNTKVVSKITQQFSIKNYDKYDIAV